MNCKEFTPLGAHQAQQLTNEHKSATREPSTRHSAQAAVRP